MSIDPIIAMQSPLTDVKCVKSKMGAEGLEPPSDGLHRPSRM